MPAKMHDPVKPSIYLDTSTLSDACDGARGLSAAPSEYARLGAWVETVAREANLVVSGLHVLELRR